MREKYGDSQTACATALGLTQSSISQILSEKNAPSFGTAQAIAKASGIEVSALLEGAA
jgi:transcriptional regulator with XRE-family HTH domain